MRNSIYEIKYLLFLSWDWEAWCLTVWGVITPPPERNTAWNKGRKCFHCLGSPNNLIHPWVWCIIVRAVYFIMWLHMTLLISVLLRWKESTGWGISRLTPLYPTNGLLAAFKMAAVAPLSHISYTFTPNHYILRARCVRHAVRGTKGC